jgi:hypothetical protein
MAWNFVIQFAIALGTAILAGLLTSRPKAAKPAALEDFSVPTADEGREIPVVFGEVWLKSPNVVWYGDLRVEDIRKRVKTSPFTSTKVKIGDRYYMGLHMALCYGPVDAVLEIEAGERTAWTGTVTTSSAINIDAPDLFGGDEKEGGIVATVDVMMGTSAQAANDYLTGVQTGAQPGYRGVLGLVVRQGLLTSNAAYIKPWAVLTRRILQGWQAGSAWNAARAVISLPDSRQGMNPAHIVYECLTNSRWGMGYNAGIIDLPSFEAAADLFHAEGMGLCIGWQRQESIENFIEIVAEHAGMVVGQNPRTGLFQLVPIRDNYEPATAPLFDPSNITTLESYQRAESPDKVNEITITWTDERGKDQPATAQNLASIQSQQAIVTQTKAYPGLPTAGLAQRLALRDIQAQTTPLARVRFRANRSASGLAPGQIIRFTWPKLGITALVLRVLRVSQGPVTMGIIEVEAIEDVFGLPAATYIAQPPGGWLNPNNPPAAATLRVVEEASYLTLLGELPTAEFDALGADDGYIAATAARPTQDAVDYGLWERTGSDPYELAADDRGVFSPTGQLAAALDFTTTAATVINAAGLNQVDAGDLAYIGAEIVRVTTINATTGAVTLGRGCLDSVAGQHDAGARVYFVSGNLRVSDVRRAAGAAVDVRLTPRTGIGELAVASAPTDTITMARRADRPYPPARLRINAAAYPATTGRDSALTWRNRNRLDNIVRADEDASVTIEASTETRIRVFSPPSALRATITATGTSRTLTWAEELAAGGPFSPITFRVDTIRDGREARAAHAVTLARTGLATAPPLVADELVQTFTTATTSHDVTMPASVDSGDRLLVGIFNNGSSTVTTPAGWTQIGTRVTGSSRRVTWLYLDAAGTEGGTSIDFVTGAAQRAVAITYRVTVGSFDATQAPLQTGADASSSTTMDPPAITAAWSLRDALIIGSGVNTGANDPPLEWSYADGRRSGTTGSGTGQVSGAASYVQAETLTADPGPFLMSTSAAVAMMTVMIAGNP